MVQEVPAGCLASGDTCQPARSHLICSLSMLFCHVFDGLLVDYAERCLSTFDVCKGFSFKMAENVIYLTHQGDLGPENPLK